MSAAKEQSLLPESTKKTPIPPSVTVTPTSAPISTSHNPTQKPFTITVTSVPSSSASIPKNNSFPNMMSSASKESFSSFLAQAEQQNLLLKKQQQQRKSYEAMIADINKVADFSSKVNSYSHEAKVNKWLAEQNAALAEQPLSSDYLAPRRRRPRVDPTLLDWKKLTGDENVSVINRVSGKKLTGPKAPTLKRLGQWLMDNPMYDIDPKWAELVKERGNLSHDLQKRLPGSAKKGTPGRPPLLSSPTGSSSSANSANLATSMASSLNFPSLASSGLSGLNSSLLSGLSSLGQFDPKNPLLMPFGGMPSMSALSSMGGLNNLTNMNFIANLAGLGLPGLAGLDSAMTGTSESGSKSTISSSTTTSSMKNKQSKPSEAHSSSKPPTSSASSGSSIPTTSPFPFFFPNPGLLYTPLGLGGINPFSLQPGMSAAYDTLAQQCGLLNGGLNPSASPNTNSKSSKLNTSRPQTSTSSTISSSQSPSSKPRIAARETAQLQQLLLPPDTHLLESLSKAANLEAMKQAKSDKKDDKRKALESLRGILPTDFTSIEKVKSKKDNIPGFSDFSKFLEGSGMMKKTKEQEMKEALEQLSKANPEFLARALAEEQKSSVLKRQREITPVVDLPENLSTEEENQPKKFKENDEKPVPQITSPSIISTSETLSTADVENLLPPSTVVKVTNSVSDTDIENSEKNEPEPVVDTPKLAEAEPVHTEELKTDKDSNNEISEAPKEEVNIDAPVSSPKKNTKRTRGKRKSGELLIDPETIREKKNLRSSASRSAAAAAARAEREQAAAKLEAD